MLLPEEAWAGLT